MKDVNKILLKSGSQEERLPAFSPDFPYTASKACPDTYEVIWHWHKAVELFYIENGALEYYTPGGMTVFPRGSGGLVNSGVLHMTKARAASGSAVQLLHIFEPSFLSGYAGSRIERKYIAPITASSIEILPFYPENPLCGEILAGLKDSFFLSENAFGYEIALREALSHIWLKLLALPRPDPAKAVPGDEKIKQMMIYIHNHFPEKLRVPDIAAAGFVSQRECYRLFQRVLRMTPMDYLREYRLQAACRLLVEAGESVTNISYACGFGSASAFGRAFREKTGFTPAAYRRKWQDSDK